jgi:hypothetical protein
VVKSAERVTLLSSIGDPPALEERRLEQRVLSLAPEFIQGVMLRCLEEVGAARLAATKVVGHSTEAIDQRCGISNNSEVVVLPSPAVRDVGAGPAHLGDSGGQNISRHELDGGAGNRTPVRA